MLKINTLNSVLFKTELSELKKHEDMLTVIKDRMKNTSKLILVKWVGGENGEMMWSVLKDKIEDIKEQHDKQKGRDEALADQRAAEARARAAFAGDAPADDGMDG